MGGHSRREACPRCGYLYVAGVRTCPRCKTALPPDRFRANWRENAFIIPTACGLIFIIEAGGSVIPAVAGVYLVMLGIAIGLRSYRPSS